MPEPPESWVMVAAAERPAQAREIAYALGLRSIQTRTVKLSAGVLRGKAVAVEVRAEDESRAREALPFIYDGMASVSRATTELNACPYCGYDLAGLPGNRPCPECGKDLTTPDALRQARRAGGL